VTYLSVEHVDVAVIERPGWFNDRLLPCPSVLERKRHVEEVAQ